MDRASLGDVRGAGEVRSRRRGGSSREYRGTFAAGQEHAAALEGLVNSRKELEFEGLVDGERRRLKVFVTDLSPETGIVYFQGSGEPY